MVCMSRTLSIKYLEDESNVRIVTTSRMKKAEAAFGVRAHDASDSYCD